MMIDVTVRIHPSNIPYEMSEQIQMYHNYIICTNKRCVPGKSLVLDLRIRIYTIATYSKYPG